jgi:hypothetical protein
MEFALPGRKKPAYYDDHFNSGLALSVFCKVKEVMKDATFNNEEFSVMISTLSRIILNEANFTNGYWTRDDYYINYTCGCILGLIDFELHGTTITYTINEYDVIRALNNTLKRPEIRNMFFEELNRIQVVKQATDFVKESK